MTTRTSTTALIVKTAYRLHEEKKLSDKEFLQVMEDLVNGTALDNGYADAHGLPFPSRRRARSRRAP